MARLRESLPRVALTLAVGFYIATVVVLVVRRGTSEAAVALVLLGAVGTLIYLWTDPAVRQQRRAMKQRDRDFYAAKSEQSPRSHRP